MKTNLLLTFLLLTFLGYAQAPIPSYDSANGAKYTSVSNVIDNSVSGANATWNFTGLTKDGVTNDSYTSPIPQELTDYGSNTTSVFSATRGIDIGKVFTTNNAGTTSITGIVGYGLIFRYTNVASGGNALIGTFPLSYGTPSNTDNVAGTFTYIPYTIDGTFTGTITSLVDAYGILNVNGTEIVSFNGAVTRLKVVQNLVLSVANGIITQTSYNYYDDSNGNLVFRTASMSITSSLVTDSFSSRESLSGNTLGTSDNKISKTALSILPNPVKDNLNFSLNNDATVHAVSVFDISGRQILKVNTNINSISVNQLKSGIYIAMVSTSKGILSRKFVKQ